MFSAVDYGRDLTSPTSRLGCADTVSPYVRNTSRTTQQLATFVVHFHSPLHRRQQQGHVGTSRGRHEHFSQRDRLPLTESGVADPSPPAEGSATPDYLVPYRSTCRRWIRTAPWSSRWSQLPTPALRTQCSARSSYSGRECMLQLPTTYRGVCLSITLFCSFPQPRARHGLCRTRNWIMCLIMSSIPSSSPPLPSLHLVPRPLPQSVPL